MAITNENQIIDVTAISNACSVIEEAAEDYKKCASKVAEAAEICSPNALAVEKQSMQPTLEELATGIASVEQSVYSFTAQIRNVATQIYSQQYEELIAYRNRMAEEAQARQAAEAAQTSQATSGNQGQYSTQYPNQETGNNNSSPRPNSKPGLNGKYSEATIY